MARGKCKKGYHYNKGKKRCVKVKKTHKRRAAKKAPKRRRASASHPNYKTKRKVIKVAQATYHGIPGPAHFEPKGYADYSS